MDSLISRTGRRGVFLSFLSILDIGYGYGLITGIPVTNLLLSWDIWGWIWIGFGIFISTGILARMDLWQYGAATLLKTAWGLANLDSWVLHGGRGWVAAIVWLSFAATVIVISGWPEPRKITTISARDVIARAEDAKNGESG